MNGACGTCTSSAATLKMGIEKHLIKVFGKDNLKEVVNLDGSEPGGMGGEGSYTSPPLSQLDLSLLRLHTTC